MQFSLRIIAMAAIMAASHTSATPVQTSLPTIPRDAAPAAISLMTVKLTNSAGVDLYTEHVPILCGGGQGILKSGATGTYVLKPGYHGTVFVNSHDFNTGNKGSESQVETNFGPEEGKTENKVTIDVSCVVGFTYPIVCNCEGGAKVSGCSTNLWDAECPKDDHDKAINACRNPHRNGPKEAAPFFSRCAGQAYTFPQDSAAVSHDLCGTGEFHCYVGSNGKGDKAYLGFERGAVG
ncbi:hypothetical protein QBC34DRAFT_470650 [Podospora aff. communis PSN243]|uniref:Uncharacterized protein n=1 Tax=Podospora aff. communis PSN243 TaxID=3040156 RepID=A0AAV9GD62_9PEZI|nr:hypothetical protein QBC34DRAFT_470650 [Podospora aff. communis PSN243]